MNWFNIVTLVIAGWGAVLSTCVAIWQWRHSGPRLCVTAITDTVAQGAWIGGPKRVSKNTYRVIVRLVNRGGRATTINDVTVRFRSSC